MGDGEKDEGIQRQMNDRDKAAEGESVINSQHPISTARPGETCDLCGIL